MWTSGAAWTLSQSYFLTSSSIPIFPLRWSTNRDLALLSAGPNSKSINLVSPVFDKSKCYNLEFYFIN